AESMQRSAVPMGVSVPVRNLGRKPEADNLETVDALEQVEPLRVATRLVSVPVRQLPQTQSEPASSATSPGLIPSEEGDFWHALVQQLIQAEAINAMVRELALQSQLVARDTDQWILRVERESLNQSGSRDRLTNALHAAGYVVKLVVEVGRVTDCPARRNSAASAEKQLAAEKIIYGDPFVQAMVRDFGAKIVPGSIRPL
ncbi:MAG: DNA polymerase III subunit gamma/tau, partial [Rhodoferax sp.]|nr:DNA polymerase III subunit gamma/tau [Rhodoferax sp.]